MQYYLHAKYGPLNIWCGHKLPKVIKLIVLHLIQRINTVDPWTAWRLGASAPRTVKKLHITWLPMGDWLHDSSQIPKSMDAQVPYMKWHAIEQCIQSALRSHRFPTAGQNTVGWIQGYETQEYRGPTVYLLGGGGGVVVECMYKWTQVV